MSKYTCTGKVSDICPNCKNCKVVVWDGVSNIECEDPFDGMVKTMTADSNVCCSMFEMRSDKSCDKISLLQHELEMDKLRRKIHELEKEKAAHLKGIERLKKSNSDLKGAYNHLLEKCKGYIAENAELKFEVEKNKKFNTLISDLYKQIQDLKIDNARLDRLYSERDGELKELINASKRKDELIQSYRKEIAELKDKYEKLDTHYRYDEDIIKDIQDVISPEDNSIWSHSEIVYEIEKLKESNSDQEITIKALLLTIKEMCKDE